MNELNSLSTLIFVLLCLIKMCYVSSVLDLSQEAVNTNDTEGMHENIIGRQNVALADWAKVVHFQILQV